MTNTQEKILEIFKKHKTPKEGVIRPQSFDINSWDRLSQDEFAEAINQLIEEGYVSVKEGWYLLTEKGYDYIFRNYSIKDTEEVILNFFRKHKIREGEVLMQRNFNSLQEEDRFHFDNFNNAMQNLILEGLIEITVEKNYFKLTQAGYNRVYL